MESRGFVLGEKLPCLVDAYDIAIARKGLVCLEVAIFLFFKIILSYIIFKWKT